MFSCATEMKLSGLTATWMKDNKPIGDAMADRVKITAKDNVFTLEVSSVKVEDKGQYTCRVTNAGGDVATCSAQLEVHQRKKLKFCKRIVQNSRNFLCFKYFQLAKLAINIKNGSILALGGALQ